MKTGDIDKAIRTAKANGADVWLTDGDDKRGVGRLRARVTPTGKVTWYFRYTDSSGKRDQLPLATLYRADDGKASILGAEAEAAGYSRLYREHRDLRAYLQAEEVKKAARLAVEEVARQAAERRANSGRFSGLLDGYVKHLERDGKQSAQDVRNLFKRNILTEFPDLAAKRAADITRADVTAILAKLIDRGAGRTAAKVRSYVSAAFTVAAEAEGDPTAHPDLHGFEIESNPVERNQAKKFAKFKRERVRNLNRSELRAFLKALDGEPGLAADVIRLTLYLGGQRIAQLARVTPAEVDLEGRTILLHDGKGARLTPRLHLLPLTDRAAEIVQKLLERAAALAEDGQPVKYIITSYGDVPVRSETLSAVVRDISAKMVADKTAREPFELRDLRRTCETMLAGLGVSKDVRAQLLSHGLSGVQTKHYDMHEYMDEKRHALERWDARLREIMEDEAQSNVVQLRPTANT